MDTVRFENAARLHDDGLVEDARREFHSMADEAEDADEKAAILSRIWAKIRSTMFSSRRRVVPAGDGGLVVKV
ncbi:MAG: hypothetical protein WAN03_02405 [Candidatus Sulfotelmatobacter sp.]